MKRLLIALMVLCPVAAMGQTTAAKGFPLTVHVVGSKWVNVPESGGATTYLYLRALIGGKKYLLATPAHWNKGLLVPGAYKARLAWKGNEASYEVDRTYLLEFPDGKTQKFGVEAVGEW